MPRPRRPRPPIALERPFLRAVTDLLTLLSATGRILCWHHVPDTKRTRPEQRGFLDLTIGVTPGSVVAIELKRPDGRGRVSPEQSVWLTAWGERGCVARSLDEVLTHMRRWGVEV